MIFKMNRSGILLILPILVVISTVNCANILIPTMSVAKSLAMYHNKLGCILKEKGHNVTIVQLLYSGSIGNIANTCNMTQIDFEPNLTEESRQLLPNFVKSWTYTPYINLKPLHALVVYDQMLIRLCQPLFSNQTLLNLLRSTQFDVAIVHAFSLCPTALAVEFGATIIWSAPGAYVVEAMTAYLQLPNRLSHTPDTFTTYSDRMGFWQRVHQVLWTGHQYVYRNLPYNRFEMERQLFEQQFPNARHASLTLEEYSHQIPFTIFNSISLVDFPRPITHELVYLNSLEKLKRIDWDESVESHVTTKGEMAEEFESFIGKYPKGFIVFSLGSQASFDSMPQQMKDAFIASFHHFPDYAIFWKVDSTLELPAALGNVHVGNWLPQKPLLRHPAAKLFITHGGYNSLLESCDAGVPLLLLPLFLDQFVNSRRAERLGFALSLEKTNLTEEAVVSAMSDILTNDNYKKRARKVSSMISDLPISSIDSFAHLVGKTHRNSKALLKMLKQKHELNFAQTCCLDIVIALATVPVAFCLCIYIIINCLH